MATLIDYNLMSLDLKESCQCSMHEHAQLFRDSEVSKRNQSRWPSDCTGFHGHHVVRKECIKKKKKTLTEIESSTFVLPWSKVFKAGLLTDSLHVVSWVVTILHFGAIDDKREHLPAVCTCKHMLFQRAWGRKGEIMSFVKNIQSLVRCI